MCSPIGPQTKSFFEYGMTPLTRSIQLVPDLPIDLLTSTFDTNTLSVTRSYSNAPHVQTTTHDLDSFNIAQVFSRTNAETQLSFLTLSILVIQHILDRELISMSSSFCLSSFFMLKFFTSYSTFVIIKYSYKSLHT